MIRTAIRVRAPPLRSDVPRCPPPSRPIIEGRSTRHRRGYPLFDADDPALVGGIHGGAGLSCRTRRPSDGRSRRIAASVRASVAVAVVTFALLLDYSGTFHPEGLLAVGRTPDATFAIALERVVLFGLIRWASSSSASATDRHATASRSGTGAGAPADGARGGRDDPGHPVVRDQPDVRAFYAPSDAPLGRLLLTNGLDLLAAEFAFRGFLMMTLVRVIGPFGVLVATMPFVFGHLGKPELELSRRSVAGSSTAGSRGGRGRSCGARSATSTS